MRRGRPPLGPKLVEHLEGSGEAKKRFRVILETVSGEKSIGEATRELGIGEAAFHKLRTAVLQRAVESLEPRRPGRPPVRPSPEASRVEELERKVNDLEVELVAAAVREEVALTMPHLLKKTPDPPTVRKKPKKKRRSIDTKRDT